MPTDTKKKDKEKKPLSLEAQLYKKAVSTMEKKVAEETEAQLATGRDKNEILRDLLGTISTDPQAIVQELAEEQLPIPKSQVGIKGTLGSLLKGKVVSPYTPRTEPRGQAEAIKMLKDALTAAEQMREVPEETVKEEKAKEALGQKPITGGVAEREATIAGRQEGIKALEKGKVEDLAKAQKTTPKTFRFIQQYARSVAELKKFDPEIEKIGLEGKARRIRAIVAENLDQLPETSALEILIQPLANGMAREVEGGRVTDQDRTIYANAFANALRNPGATNRRLVSAQIIELIDKGANMIPSLKQMAATDLDLFDDIINQVLTAYPELVEDIYGEGAEVIE